MLKEDTVAVKYGVTLLSAMGIEDFKIPEIFSQLGRAQVNIDIISFLPDCLSFTVSDDSVGLAMKYMGSFSGRVYCVSSNNSQITIWGNDIDDTAKVTDDVLAILYRENIKEKLLVSSLGKITLVLTECYTDTVINGIKRGDKKCSAREQL